MPMMMVDNRGSNEKYPSETKKLPLAACQVSPLVVDLSGVIIIVVVIISSNHPCHQRKMQVYCEYLVLGFKTLTRSRRLGLAVRFTAKLEIEKGMKVGTSS